MNTLITPAQAVASAFTDGEYLAPEAIGEGDIAAAEQRYIVPVIGRAFHEKLLAGLHAGFTAEYLAAPVALFTRIAVQPRLDIRTGQCGTVAPKSGSYQPADAQSLRELQRSLRRQARTLCAALRNTSKHMPRNFPGTIPTTTSSNAARPMETLYRLISGLTAASSPCSPP